MGQGSRVEGRGGAVASGGPEDDNRMGTTEWGQGARDEGRGGTVAGGECRVSKAGVDFGEVSRAAVPPPAVRRARRRTCHAVARRAKAGTSRFAAAIRGSP